MNITTSIAITLLASTSLVSCKQNTSQSAKAKDVVFQQSSYDGKTPVGSIVFWTFAPGGLSSPEPKCWYMTNVTSQNIFDYDTAKKLDELSKRYANSTKIGQILSGRKDLTQDNGVSSFEGDPKIAAEYDQVVSTSKLNLEQLKSALPRIIDDSAVLTSNAVQTRDVLARLRSKDEKNKIPDVDQNLTQTFTDPLYAAVNAELKGWTQANVVKPGAINAEAFAKLTPGGVQGYANVLMSTDLVMSLPALAFDSKNGKCPKIDDTVLYERKSQVAANIIAQYSK